MEVSAAPDPVIHPIHRLRICAMLSGAKEIDFTTVQQSLELSASNLSKQVAQLAAQGYVEQRRAATDSRRVWLSLTGLGRERYAAHLSYLVSLASGSDDEVTTD